MTLKIIGAGLGRTGTASAKLALEQLGFGPCYHMGEILGNLSFVPLWEAVGEGNPDWDTIFEGYQSGVDYPTCTYWRELMDFYPEAKVILTVRDANSWFDSVNTTIMSPECVNWIYSGPMEKFFRTCVYGTIGEPEQLYDRAFMTAYFDQWVKNVVDIVPAERLLVFHVKEGWEPLCRFLDIPVPNAEFPRVNSREDTLASLQAMIHSSEEQREEIMKSEKENLFK